MSALESPPSLTPIWQQDPWCSVTASAVTGAISNLTGAEDFYGHNLQNKGLNVSPMIGNQAAFYHSHHSHHLNHHQTPMVPQGYHHPGLMEPGTPNNNNNSMNSDANSSSTTSSTTSTNGGSGWPKFIEKFRQLHNRKRKQISPTSEFQIGN